MKIIKLKFSATSSLYPTNSVSVVLTLDEKGKSYKVKYDNESFSKKLKKELANLGVPENELPGNHKELPYLPKRVLAAFTENAINKILSKDEIPNESGMMVLDGYHYEISITKGDIKKKYDANDVTIETYPLLRYLASWCRKR